MSEKAKSPEFTQEQERTFSAWVVAHRTERCGHGNAKASCSPCARNRRRSALKKLRRKR